MGAPLTVVGLDYLKQKQEIELAYQRSVAGWEAQYMLCKLLQAKAMRDAALKEFNGDPLNLIWLA